MASLGLKNRYITVCHSCSHATGAPGNTPASPRHGGRTCAPQPGSASSPNTFMQNTQWRSECSRERPSPHLGAEASPPATAGGHGPTADRT